jgi:hypothetical protein
MDDPGQTPPQHALKPKPFETVNAPLSQEPSQPIRVEDILKDNLAVREAIAPLELDLERKISKRKRDYLFLLVAGNLAILVVIYFLPRDPLLRTLGYSMLALYTFALSWIMWAVMGDY